MKWLLFLLFAACSSEKISNRWCYHPENQNHRCYSDKEKCEDAVMRSRSGVSCRPVQNL